MDARLSALETDVRDMKAILGRLEPLLGRMDDRLRRVETEAQTLPRLATDVAELKGCVSQLPTTIQIFTYMTGLLGFSLALSVAVLGLARYFGH